MSNETRSIPDAILLMEEDCLGPKHAVPQGASPGKEVVVIDPILNGDLKTPRIICDNLNQDGSCKLASTEQCIFKSKGAPLSLNPHLYTRLA